MFMHSFLKHYLTRAAIQLESHHSSADNTKKKMKTLSELHYWGTDTITATYHSDIGEINAKFYLADIFIF